MFTRPFPTFIASLLLLGLLSACMSNPATEKLAANPTSTEQGIDTAQVDSTAITFDQPTQDQIAQSQLYDKWIKIMDPFVIQNPNTTFTFNSAAFLTSIVSTYPEVVAYYEGTGPATDDTVAIDTLIAGFDIVNPLALADYNEVTQNGTAPPPPSGSSFYYKWYWWGYGQCYTGSYSANEAALICVGGAVISYYGGGGIGVGYTGYFCYWATYYDGRYDGFCIYALWGAPFTSISRP